MLCTKYFTRNTKKDYYRLGQAITNQRHVSYKTSGMQSILCIIYNILDVSSIVLGCVVFGNAICLVLLQVWCILYSRLGIRRCEGAFAVSWACMQSVRQHNFRETFVSFKLWVPMLFEHCLGSSGFRHWHMCRLTWFSCVERDKTFAKQSAYLVEYAPLS